MNDFQLLEVKTAVDLQNQINYQIGITGFANIDLANRLETLLDTFTPSQIDLFIELMES
jgi:hypothetical protein